MKYLSYLIGGAVCAGGSACAVVVPVSLNSSGRVPRPLISKCDQEGLSRAESVTFGDEGAERVCWKLKNEDSDQEESVTTADNASENQLTSLLQEIWRNREDLSSRAELNGAWKSNCTEGKWMLSSTSQGGSSERVWGYCRGETGGESSFPFVEFTSGDSSSKQLRVCFQGKKCWTDSSGGESTATLNSKDAGEWKTLEFQKK